MEDFSNTQESISNELSMDWRINNVLSMYFEFEVKNFVYDVLIKWSFQQLIDFLGEYVGVTNENGIPFLEYKLFDLIQRSIAIVFGWDKQKCIDFLIENDYAGKTKEDKEKYIRDTFDWFGMHVSENFERNPNQLEFNFTYEDKKENG
jgi:hypothetical protein